MSYVIPQVKSQSKLTFKYNGAKLWNFLPLTLKKIENKDNFKVECKKHLFNKMQEIENSEYIYY